MYNGKLTYNGEIDAFNNAAIWLREHLDIPQQCTIFNEFEEHFNCRLLGVDRGDSFACPSYVQFNTERDAIAFFLKWC